MKILKKLVTATACAVLTVSLSGCVMTVDQMYVPPRRSESYRNLQTVMDGFMRDLEYCAPTSGENQQSVQMADINGDGEIDNRDATRLTRYINEWDVEIF